MNDKFSLFLNKLIVSNPGDHAFLEAIISAYSVMMETPHITASRAMKDSFHNIYTPTDIKSHIPSYLSDDTLLQKIEQHPTYSNVLNDMRNDLTELNDIDVFDIYQEQEGKLRADGEIHEPIKYLKDIMDGKFVISPRDNVPIKISKEDGVILEDWITSDKIAMMQIIDDISKSPVKASILPFSFYVKGLMRKTIDTRKATKIKPLVDLIINELKSNPDKVSLIPFNFFSDAVMNNTLSSTVVQQLLPAPTNTHLESVDGTQTLESYISALYLPQIVAAAQAEYDAWIETMDKPHFQDVYAGGGICHLIADKICEVFRNDDKLDYKTFSYDHENHVVVQCKWTEDEGDPENGNIDIVTIDVPWRLYETGGGYSFEPILDVTFDTRDVTFYSQYISMEDWDY